MRFKMSDDLMSIFIGIAEAGGVSGVVAITIAMLIRLVKRNGCTCKFYNCAGRPCVEVDCEEGAPTERFKATDIEANTLKAIADRFKRKKETSTQEVSSV